MELTYTYRHGEKFLIGYLDEYPEYPTQGEDLSDLELNLLDIYEMIQDGTFVMVRPAAKIVSVASNTVPSDINIRALWDTGAGMSVISENIVKRLFPLVRVAE